MYINKIIELLQKYINDYEAKKYELEVLKTKKTTLRRTYSSTRK